MFRKLIRGTAAVAALALSVSVAQSQILAAGGFLASAATPRAPGPWTFPVGPGGAVGGIGGPIAFVVPVPGLVHINITDCCLVGDVYEAMLDGVSIGITAPVPIGGPGVSIGDWFIGMGAGVHVLDIWDIIHSYLGVPSPFGGGIVPLGYSPAGGSYLVEMAPVPEPASILLLGTGVAGLMLVARRRRTS